MDAGLAVSDPGDRGSCGDVCCMFRKAQPGRVRRTFRMVFIAFSPGSNDGQEFRNGLNSGPDLMRAERSSV